ncbi:MAG: VWA domain-containing protein, partial [Anaerolineales bacterium]
FIQLPLTGDLDTVRRFLDAASPAAISLPGSEISAALRTALNGFDPVRARQKVMLLVSDGETPAEDVLAAAQAATDEGIRIYTLGLGTTDGALVPEYNTTGEQIGYKRTVSGESIVSHLNEALLQEISEIGSGRYYRIGGGEDAAGLLSAEFQRLQSRATLAQIENLPVERFQLFLLPAWLLLLASILLPERRAQHGSTS